MKPTVRHLAVPVLLLGALALAACGNDSKSADTTTTTSSSTTTTEATTTTAPDQQQTARFDKAIQSELAAVGCYKGNIDGILGPQSDAAILAFQRASGLVPDGELGPNTEKALSAAASARTTVCQAAASTTTTTKPATTTTFAPNDAPCTAAAILGGLPAEGEKVTSFVCAGQYAAGSLDNGSKFILKAQGGKWYALSTDPCGGASAGLPPVILQNGCGG